jgi:hypothetical protein
MRKRRWNRPSVTTFDAWVTGVDDDGTWLRTDPLTFHHDASGSLIYVATQTWVGLVPPDAMWLAFFAGGNWKVDLCLPPIVGDHEIEFSDLELDIVLDHEDPVPTIVDRDEFEDLGLPAELAEDCERTAREIVDAIASGSPPFGDRLRDRLGRELEPGPRLVRHGWIAPLFDDIRPRLQGHFGDDAVEHMRRHDAGEATLLVAGARGDARVLVMVDTEAKLVGLDSRPAPAPRGTDPLDGLDELAALCLEAGARLVPETSSRGQDGRLPPSRSAQA